MEIKRVRVNDYDMTYSESGTGLPLVLVHGSLGDYRSWKAQIPCFAQQYRTIAVSLRHAYPEKWDGRAGELDNGRGLNP